MVWLEDLVGFEYEGYGLVDFVWFEVGGDGFVVVFCVWVVGVYVIV